MVKELFTAPRSFDQGLDLRSSILLAAMAAGGVVVTALPAVMAPITWWLRLILVALSVAVPCALVVWARKRIDEYAKTCEKALQLGRRARKRIDYLESILQDSTDIIFTIDPDGFILKFNKGAEIHFGYTQTNIVGKPLGQLFVNEADERKLLNAVLLTGKSLSEELPMKTRDGQVIFLDTSVSEMKIETGQIIGLVLTAKDITEKKKLEMELVRKNEQLSRLAITDSLTELFNVRHFYGQIKRELTRMKRNPGRVLSLMMIDIDHFKELNDTEGHQMGDQVLRSLAQVIMVCIRRDVDSGFRYGGDEFVVVLPDTDPDHARIAGERIAKQYGAFRFGQTSLSIGITEARADDDEETLVKRADEAMYVSKRSGRDQITVA